MDQRVTYIVIAAVVIVGLLLIGWFISRRRRTELLRDRFGPEYERAVREIGPIRAEATLLERAKRVEKFSLRQLTSDEHERFVAEWRTVQTRFVDAPREAVNQADRLVDLLMAARGYPVTDFEQRAADLSVDHPRVVENYRAAHQIALRHRRGEATTEDLRKAVLYYRSLFEDLLPAQTTTVRATTIRKEVA
jgi:FtsZ-interacting cell division protein ZipA